MSFCLIIKTMGLKALPWPHIKSLVGDECVFAFEQWRTLADKDYQHQREWERHAECGLSLLLISYCMYNFTASSNVGSSSEFLSCACCFCFALSVHKQALASNKGGGELWMCIAVCMWAGGIRVKPQRRKRKERRNLITVLHLRGWEHCWDLGYSTWKQGCRSPATDIQLSGDIFMG